MDGLIIKQKWLDKILRREKPLEIMGTKTKKIGQKIYLIESNGKVRGTAFIARTLSLDEYKWEILKDYHCVDMSWEELTKRYKQSYAWELQNVQTIEPFDYAKHQGAVIWVKNVEEIKC